MKGYSAGGGDDGKGGCIKFHRIGSKGDYRARGICGNGTLYYLNPRTACTSAAGADNGDGSSPACADHRTRKANINPIVKIRGYGAAPSAVNGYRPT